MILQPLQEGAVTDPHQINRFSPICELIQPTDAVLDVGCGEGLLLDALAAGGHKGDYLGIDASAEAIVRAAAKHGAARFRLSSIETFETKPWDIVVLAGILSHLRRPLHQLQRYANSARYGGQVIVTLCTGSNEQSPTPGNWRCQFGTRALARRVSRYIATRHAPRVQPVGMWTVWSFTA